MANVFLISDHHLNHSNILTFFEADGVTRVRSFVDVDEMNETIISRHNAVVGPGDKTYFLGDVCFSNKALPLVARMNGEKVLIKGNHDKLKLSQYLPYFKDVRGSHQFDGMLLTHIPVHPASLARWGLNVHGHLHTNVVEDVHGNKDYRYFNVCVEQLNYTPISLEEIKAQIKNQS